MISKEDISTLLFWKRKLEEIGRKGAILILTKDDDEIIATIAEYVPFFMKKHRYISFRVISDSGEKIKKFINCVKIPCESEIVSAKYFDCMFRLENAFGIYGRIYSDVSVPMEDGDFYGLVGYDNITLRDIVAYVILRLDHVPTKGEIAEGREWLIDNKKYEDIFFPVRSLTGRYEKTDDKDLAERQKEIIDSKVKLEEKNIYLYGDSDYSKLCLEVYRDYSIVGIIDRDESKIGQQRDGIKIYSPDKIRNIDFSSDVVVITNRRYEDVALKLVSHGGTFNKDFFILNPRPDIVDWDDEDLKNYIVDELCDAEKIYCQLRESYTKEKLLLSPWKASGDIYVVGLYLDDYVMKNCPDGHKLIVTSPMAKKIALLLGYEAELITEDEMDTMLEFIRYEGFEETNSINTNFNYHNKMMPQRVTELHRILDFNTGHQRMAFLSDVKRTRGKLEQKNSDFVFGQYNLEKRKTILIAPYSNTLGNIPEEYGVKLVEDLKKKGYSVCTNIAGDEKPIEGTIGVFLPYDIVLDFVNKCTGVIGIRSGVFDVISSSHVKMAVFYPKSHFNMFSLVHMGLKTDEILELNTTDCSWDEIVDRTIVFFEKGNDNG